MPHKKCKIMMIKKCPTCGNMIEAKVRHEFVAGVIEKQIVFECPCGYFGAARPH